ncbi:lanC-like protein 2 [Mytilus trossulus]|uniref:lanC-like protein 2 n=1 Tax=Mytilus trossulus TaxID=6551 RepID=UPI0030068231
MSEKREFENPFPQHRDEYLTDPKGQLKPERKENVQRAINKLLEKLYRGLESEDDSNYTVYTGTAGIALLHIHLHRKLESGSQQYLKTGLEYLKKPLRHLKGRKYTFLCGDAGPLAIGAVINHMLKHEDDSKSCLDRLAGLHDTVCIDRALPNEALYGRVGYLYSLFYVQHHIGEEVMDNALISKVASSIIDSGRRLSQQEQCHFPLMYEWHEKKYLGAAHGIAGILYLLMQVKDPSFNDTLQTLVRPTVDWMLSLQFPSGNCPSSIGSSSGDKLIHWCHGAPGWIYMFIKAYQLFSDEKYLEAAKRCSAVIWERGILKKGYGICHGTAGNGYAFLAMYRLTNDQKYLYQAYKFGEWCINYGKHGCRSADTPYSLFEGMAGTIYFLTDLLDPSNARFPAFEL